jgi:signal transduction histidine kinase
MSEHRASHTAEIVASIAHDLRSPLNAVIGFSRVMLKGIDGPLSEMQATDLQAIYANGQAMLEMVDDLIDVAKAEAGWLTPVPVSVYVPQLVQKACSSGGSASPLIPMICPSGADLPSACADLAQAQKAVDRLVAAAILLAGSGEIAVELSADDTDVIIELTCTCPDGLAPEAPHILEAFRTSGASLEHRVTRTSLKLLVSSRLAAMNGGAVQIISTSQAELALAMRLPLSQPAGSGTAVSPSQT